MWGAAGIGVQGDKWVLEDIGCLGWGVPEGCGVHCELGFSGMKGGAGGI